MNSTDEREASGNHSVHLCRTDFPFNQIISMMSMKLDEGFAETSLQLQCGLRYDTVQYLLLVLILCYVPTGTVVFGNGNGR
jgi:hypothetical protein